MIKIEVNEGKLPGIIGIGAIAAGTLFGIVVLCSNASGMTGLSSYLVIFLIIVTGAGMCIGGRNRKLTVEDRMLCYTDRFGRKRIFSLDEIGYCQAALEERGGRDYLKLYDLLGEKLCKLEFAMKNSALFLQYLLDNQVRVECSEKSDDFLKGMLHTRSVCAEEIPEAVNACFEEAKELVWEWSKAHRQFQAEWKMGIAAYLEKELSDPKQLWEQKGCSGSISLEELPEGYLIAIEGYLQKEDLFVFDKKNRAVMFYVPVISVSKSMQTDEAVIIRFFGNVKEELACQLDWLSHVLPQKRYHTRKISINHELRERL